MTYFSENDFMYLGSNYTRGMLCEYMGINPYPRVEIEKGIYKPTRFSSVFIFSTIKNRWKLHNLKKSDALFIFSGNGDHNASALIQQHRVTNNELLLFIRMTEETGFYYFGRCEYAGEYRLNGYRFPLYGLELKDTSFSLQANNINVPGEDQPGMIQPLP